MKRYKYEKKVAGLLNPSTIDFEEEELQFSRDLIKKYPGLSPEEVVAQYYTDEAKKNAEKGLLNAIIRFFRNLFKR